MPLSAVVPIDLHCSVRLLQREAGHVKRSSASMPGNTTAILASDSFWARYSPRRRTTGDNLQERMWLLRWLEALDDPPKHWRRPSLLGFALIDDRLANCANLPNELCLYHPEFSSDAP